MQPHESMTATINGKIYRVATAQLLADNHWWDGHNFERHGTNSFLYRTPRGSYFAVHLTQWQGSRHSLEPLTERDARALYEVLPEKRVELDVAFPGTVIEEA